MFPLLFSLTVTGKGVYGCLACAINGTIFRTAIKKTGGGGGGVNTGLCLERLKARTEYNRIYRYL